MGRVRELVRRIGWGNALLFAIDTALRRATGGRARLVKYYFMAQPVPRETLPAVRASGIAVDELRAGDPRLARLGRVPEELARRFASGARCFAAWQGETLAGFLWFTGRAHDESEVRCSFRVDPEEAAVWDFDVHVEPRFRLGRTFALLWERAFEAMRAEGVRWSLSRVAAFKAESLRAHQRLGARQTGWAVFLLLGSVQVTLTSLGQLKCRWLEHGPYPAFRVRAPTEEATSDAAAALAGEGEAARRAS